MQPSVYGWIYSIVMLSYGLSALAQQKLIGKISSNKLILISALLSAFGGILMFCLISININHPIIIVGPMLIFMMGFATLWPQSVAACLQPFPDKAGAASSLQGFIQNSMAAVVSALLSLSSNDTGIPLGSAMVICGILTLITAIIIYNKSNRK